MRNRIRCHSDFPPFSSPHAGGLPSPGTIRASGPGESFPASPSRIALRALSLISLLLLASSGCRSAEEPAQSAALPPDAPLVPADAESFEEYMKQGLAMVEVPDLRFALDDDVFVAPASDAIPTALAASGSETAGVSFSSTNLQTVGVDEADRIKFDGEFLYVARSPELDYSWPEPLPGPDPIPPPPLLPADPIPTIEFDTRFLYPETRVIAPARVMVYRTSQEPASAEPIGSIEIEGPVEIRGLVTLGPSADAPPLLVVIATEGNEFYGGVVDFWNPWFHNAGKLHVHVFDVEDPSEPIRLLNWRFEGTALAIRRVGKRLILVSSFAPYLRTLAENTEPDARDRLIADARVEDLLPRSWLGGVEESEPLVAAERCFVPVDETLSPEHRPTHFRPILATIASLNLRNLDDRITVCTAGPVDRIFSSTRSLYLAATRSGAGSHSGEVGTIVHKFGYTDAGPRFRGSAEVPGRPAGSQPGFGLGENAETFGILTTESGSGSDGAFRERHRLTLLREDPDDELRLVETAHLPNASNPEPIGKPDERVYGVRFVADRVYVVTFRRIDPLYVIDISDAFAPFVAGELELPGFSDFLQPLGNELLLGVGMASIAGGDGFDLFQGVKVELFDISDPSAPSSLDSLEIGKRGSGSSARNDHQAVNWLAGGENDFRVVVPVAVHEESRAGDPADPRTHYGWSHTGLQLIEVDGLRGRLVHIGEVSGARLDDTDPASSGTYGDRARIQGEAVHYIHDGQVWSASWSDPEGALGPQ